jgi:predicted ATPase
MKLKQLKLSNFRMFGEVIIRDLPDVTIFVSPNGYGKSTILEAIAAAHALAAGQGGGFEAAGVTPGLIRQVELADSPRFPKHPTYDPYEHRGTYGATIME